MPGLIGQDAHRHLGAAGQAQGCSTAVERLTNRVSDLNSVSRGILGRAEALASRLLGETEQSKGRERSLVSGQIGVANVELDCTAEIMDALDIVLCRLESL